MALVFSLSLYVPGWQCLELEANSRHKPKKKRKNKQANNNSNAWPLSRERDLAWRSIPEYS
jgi:hypothetical protein